MICDIRVMRMVVILDIRAMRAVTIFAHIIVQPSPPPGFSAVVSQSLPKRAENLIYTDALLEKSWLLFFFHHQECCRIYA